MPVSRWRCCRNRERLPARLTIGRPWGIAITALLISAVPFLCGGCRKLPALAPARARIDRLVALHPNAAMLADIDRRIAALREQRGRLAGEQFPARPPATTTAGFPGLVDVPAPAPDSRLDRHADEFLAQRLDAYAQLLDRDRVERLSSERRDQAIRDAGDKAQRRAALLADAARERRAMGSRYYLDLTNAKIARSAAEERAKDGTRTAARRAAEAREQYRAVEQAYHEALARIDADCEAKIRAAYGEIEARGRESVQASDHRMRDTNARLLDNKRTELAATEANVRDDAPAPPDMPAHPVPPGTVTLNAPELDRRFARADADTRRSQAAAAADIDRVIGQLQRERRLLLADLERDTRQTAETIAGWHGYRLTDETRAAPDMTDRLQNWLREYWAPQPRP